MTTTTTNDAAERLLTVHADAADYCGAEAQLPALLDAALAAERRAEFDRLLVAGLIAPAGLTYDAAKQATDRLEHDIADVTRRATVERIRAALHQIPGYVYRSQADRILDVEAER